jgi:hypothetical protein
MSLTKAQIKKIVLSFPGAIEKPSYGKPAFLIEKKFFTRLRADDDSLVLFVGSIDERDMLIEADPALFHITDHYKNYPTILARIAKLDAKTLRGMLERRWKEIAPKKLQKEIGAGSAKEQFFTSPNAGRSTRRKPRRAGGA